MSDIEEPAPIGQDHRETGRDEGDDPYPGLGVASVEETHQGEQQYQAQKDVQVPGLNDFKIV